MDDEDMNDNRQARAAGDELLEEIFRHATPRPRPSAEARARAWESLQADWREQLARRRRRRFRSIGLAASLLAAFVAAGVWFAADDVAPPPPLGIEVLRADGGSVEVNREIHAADELASGRVRLAAGDRLATAADARLALAYRNGALRLDRSTRIRLQGDGSVRLLEGSLYFDSTPFAGAGAAPATIAIDTTLGRVTHEGTQFLTTVAAGAVAVKVREGRARLSGDRRDVTVDAGEALLLKANGGVERRAIAANDPAWQWAADIAPPIDLKGRTTAEVFTWIARETGQRVRYGSAEARRLADSEPRGIASLAPLPALRTIPYMTSLEVSIDDDVIVVDVGGGGAER